MEIRKKLKMPTGNVHDIKYLYVIINALKHKAKPLEVSDSTLEYFKKALNDYNEAKAAKYGLSFRPRSVNTRVVKHLLLELKNLNLIFYEKGRHIMLTDEGEKIATLIENKKAEELKVAFVKLILEKFSVFEFFLKRIIEVSNGNGVPIPFITSEVLDNYKEDFKEISDAYIEIVKNSTGINIDSSKNKLYDILERERIDLIPKKVDKVKKFQGIIEKFIISEAFYPEIKSRRVYDFVRARTTFLELTNYANFNFSGLPAEVVYLISDFRNHVFKYSTKEIEYETGKIFLHKPEFDEIKEDLKTVMKKVYDNNKDEFGYMKISHMRDLVCRELKISDRLFDIYVKKLYQENPHWISFTYSGASDKITEKQLPITFEKPMGEIYTLIKLNLRR
jgi:hypothetical protein